MRYTFLCKTLLGALQPLRNTLLLCFLITSKKTEPKSEILSKNRTEPEPAAENRTTTFENTRERIESLLCHQKHFLLMVPRFRKRN